MMFREPEEDLEDEKICFESGTVMSYNDILEFCELLKRKIRKKDQKLQLERIKEHLKSSVYYNETYEASIADINHKIYFCNEDLNSLNKQIKEFIKNAKKEG